MPGTSIYRDTYIDTTGLYKVVSWQTHFKGHSYYKFGIDFFYINIAAGLNVGVRFSFFHFCLDIGYKKKRDV